MERLVHSLFLLGAALGVGCGPNSSSCDIVATQGSVSVHSCVEFTDLTSSDAQQADDACTAQNQPPLVATIVDSCPTSGTLGICTLQDGDIQGQEFWYAGGGLTADIAQQACGLSGGTWTPK